MIFFSVPAKYTLMLICFFVAPGRSRNRMCPSKVDALPYLFSENICVNPPSEIVTGVPASDMGAIGNFGGIASNVLIATESRLFPNVIAPVADTISSVCE